MDGFVIENPIKRDDLGVAMFYHIELVHNLN